MPGEHNIKHNLFELLFAFLPNSVANLRSDSDTYHNTINILITSQIAAISLPIRFIQIQ